MLRLVLLLSGMVAVGLACTCGPMEYKEEFCDEYDLTVPVVLVKILPDKEKGGDRVKRSSTTGPQTTTPPSTTSPASTSDPGGQMVYVRAKVIYIYRQGTEVQAEKKQIVTLSSHDDSGMCGISHKLREGSQYIMKLSRYSPGSREVYQCDFFVDKNGHGRLGEPHKFFKKLAKKGCAEKKKKDKKNKDKKNKGKKNKGN